MDEHSDTLVRALEVLSDGNFHSGQAIGETLGITRAAVWKALTKIANLGLPLTSVKGRGYRIEGGLSLLSSDTIVSHLPPRLQNALKVNVEPIIDSTNLQLLRQAELHNHIYLAEYQSAGRGRRGRKWQSPFGQNIYLSIGYRVNEGVSGLDGLSLAIAVCIVDTFVNLGIGGLSVKWPNDIYYEGKKVAGILMEMRGDFMGETQLVTGVGINYRMIDQTTSEIDQPWTDLSSIAQDCGIDLPDRNLIAARLIESFHALFTEYQKKPFSEYFDRWLSYCGHLNQLIDLRTHSEKITGRMTGITANGGLIVEINGVSSVFHSGDVSVREIQ